MKMIIIGNAIQHFGGSNPYQQIHVGTRFVDSLDSYDDKFVDLRELVLVHACFNL